MTAITSQGLAGVSRFLRKEFTAAWPVFLFFLGGFVILISLIKLALAGFSIEIAVLSNAVVGALIAAKAALLIDETPLARSLERYPRIAAVGVKTFIYGIATLMFGYLERFLEALHKLHNFDATIRYVIGHVSHYRVAAWALGISIVFALYFSFFEISRRMGEGALWKLFFESSGTGDDLDRHSNTNRL
ncbi:MAG: hypothetical protein ACREP6_01400 [Candidatus Binataceae bacterium]